MKMNDTLQQGRYMWGLAEYLFPLCRSITGSGTLKTLEILQREIPSLTIHPVPSGSKVFDWSVPKQWEISEAYLEDANGVRIVDFANSNLHVVGYSTPVDTVLSLEELQGHLYSMVDQPDWIPYVTSYYKERWGFCMTQKMRDGLKPGNYHAVIRSRLFDGCLNYGEVLIPGETDEEILLSTYICHPSMANNELSGPVMIAALSKWLEALPHRRYSYRLVLVPETIGSITYLSRNAAYMKAHTAAGFVLTCVGDERAYSYLASRKGDTLADRAALNALRHLHPDYIHYSYLKRGSDERQYCSPGIDLPVCSVMRSKYGEYPEYHTSADDLTLVTPAGLQGCYDIYTYILHSLEENIYYRAVVPCEPQLGPRGLYPTESYKGSADAVRGMMDFLAYADGTKDLLEISDLIGVPMDELAAIARRLSQVGLLTKSYQKAED